MSTKWEYRQEIYQGADLLNQWGAEGWEVVCTIGKDNSFLILKRPLVIKRRGGVGIDAGTETRGPSTSSSGGGGKSPDPAPKKKFKELI